MRKQFTDILAIPYKTFKEKIALRKQYQHLAKKIEDLDNVLCITLKEYKKPYEL